MQEKKNKRLLLSLVVLSGVVILLFFFRNKGDSFSVNEKLYAVEELRNVNKILLESPSGKVELSYVGNRWKVNDRYNADRNLIEVLFATLQQVKPKRPVASSLQDSVGKQLRDEGVKVSLFSGNELQKSFFAGGNDQKNQAYFLSPDENESHIVSIPGYRVYASGIFELKERGWREKLIFDFNWRNFKRLETRFRNPKGNFEVVLDRNEAVITGLAEADTAKLNNFLDQLSLLTVEEYAEGKPGDSISQTQPVASFLIEDIGNRNFSLDIFAGQKELWGLLHGSEWAILDEKKILPLLRPKEFFIKR